MVNTYNISISKREATKVLGYSGIDIPLAEDVKDYSAYGTPVFMPIYLGNENTGNITYVKGGITFSIEGLKLLCATVEVSHTRNIIKTSIEGADETVKEFVGNGDYNLTIKAILGADLYVKQGASPQKANLLYPAQMVKQINDICLAPVAIPIVHKLLYQLGIYDIVVESFSFPSTPGRENIQVVEITALSDKTFVLKEKDAEANILNA